MGASSQIGHLEVDLVGVEVCLCPRKFLVAPDRSTGARVWINLCLRSMACAKIWISLCLALHTKGTRTGS